MITLGSGPQSSLPDAVPDQVVHPVLLASSGRPAPTTTETPVDRPLARALLSLRVADSSDLRPASSDLADLAEQVFGAFLGSAAPAASPVPAFIPWVSNPPGRQVLLCAALGSSTVVVRLDDGTEIAVDLPERMALSVPSGLPHRVRTDPEGVTLPVFHDRHDHSPRSQPVELFHLTEDLAVLVERQFMASSSALRPAVWDDAALSRALATHLQRAVVARSDGRPCTAADRLRERVLRDPGDAVTVAEWADRSGCSRRTLERDFRRRVSDSVRAWRNAVRAERAAELLAAGHQAKWVARRMGFAHPSAFTRAFRETHGLTPRDFRTLRAG